MNRLPALKRNTTDLNRACGKYNFLARERLHARPGTVGIRELDPGCEVWSARARLEEHLRYLCKWRRKTRPIYPERWE